MHGVATANELEDGACVPSPGTTAFPDLLQQAERSLTEVANVAELLQDGLRHWHRRGDADTQVALGVLHFRRRPPA